MILNQELAAIQNTLARMLSVRTDQVEEVVRDERSARAALRLGRRRLLLGAGAMASGLTLVEFRGQVAIGLLAVTRATNVARSLFGSFSIDTLETLVDPAVAIHVYHSVAGTSKRHTLCALRTSITGVTEHELCSQFRAAAERAGLPLLA